MSPPSATYIFAIPGSDQTEELSHRVALERIARGEIATNQWVWSPADEDWKQVSEIPALRPAPAESFIIPPGSPDSFIISPAAATPIVPPASAVTPIIPPASAIVPVAPKEPTPKRSLFGSGRKKTAEAAATTPVTTPITTPVTTPVATKEKKKKVVRPKKVRSEEEDDDGGFPIFSTFLALLFLAAYGLILGNYLLVDKPFEGSLAQTPFVLVQAHAHLGAFVQRDTLLIHVLPTTELKNDNFTDFLVDLAKSTPPPPLGGPPFAVVELTSTWLGEYGFTGSAWQKLATMDSATSDERKQFVLDNVTDRTGRALAAAGDSAARDRVWQSLLGSFNVGD